MVGIYLFHGWARREKSNLKRVCGSALLLDESAVASNSDVYFSGVPPLCEVICGRIVAVS